VKDLNKRFGKCVRLARPEVRLNSCYTARYIPRSIAFACVKMNNAGKNTQLTTTHCFNKAKQLSMLC